MAAGVEDGVVVVELHVLQAYGVVEAVDGGECGGDGVGAGLAAVGVGGEAGRVDGGDDGAGGGDGDPVAGGGEDAVGGDELLGPVAGGVLAAVGERPVVGAGQYDEDLRHLNSPGCRGRGPVRRSLRT